MLNKMACSNMHVSDKCENKVPEWMLAREGIKLIINNKGTEAQELFLKYPDSLVMFSGYSFAVMMDALMSYEEDKLTKAITTLKEVEKRCVVETGWLRQVTQKVFGGENKSNKSLADELETQIILADSQVCLAILTFLQQDISGYFKGGWVLRKAWKIYQKVYKEISMLYKEQFGELHLSDTCLNRMESPPEPSTLVSEEWSMPEINGYKQHSKMSHSKSANLQQISNKSAYLTTPSKNYKRSDSPNLSFFKKSVSINAGLSKLGAINNSLTYYNFSSLFPTQENLNEKIEKDVIIRLMGAVSFGYGLFQLGISLLPPSLMRLINILGFSTNRQNGISCLMYARIGSDMRAPLASLSLLWYHTIVRPFYAIDGTNVQAGVNVSTSLLKESEKEFSHSAVFLFFQGRVCRLKSDTKGALTSFQKAVEYSNQREIRTLCMHEIGWCHLIELDYIAAETTFVYLKSSSRWSRAFYSYLAVICAGACANIPHFGLFEDLKSLMETLPSGTQLDEFLTKRSRCFLDDLEAAKDKNTVFWKLLVFEMLYLWNALPSCSEAVIKTIVEDCECLTKNSDEPMLALSKLILGCCYCIQGRYEDGLDSFKCCLESRKNIPTTSDDAHISAFCLYELGALLLKNEETAPEGKIYLQQISAYSVYDFEQKLNVRVYSLLK